MIGATSNGAALFIRITASAPKSLIAPQVIMVGWFLYTKPSWDLRLFTPTPRNSKAWKDVYARRTIVERTFKRILVDYKIELANARTKKRWFWQATLAAIN